MAEGLLRHDGAGEYEAASAGSKPCIVRPEAIAVMKEIGRIKGVHAVERVRA